MLLGRIPRTGAMATQAGQLGWAVAPSAAPKELPRSIQKRHRLQWTCFAVDCWLQSYRTRPGMPAHPVAGEGALPLAVLDIPDNGRLPHHLLKISKTQRHFHHLAIANEHGPKPRNRSLKITNGEGVPRLLLQINTANEFCEESRTYLETVLPFRHPVPLGGVASNTRDNRPRVLPRYAVRERARPRRACAAAQ